MATSQQGLNVRGMKLLRIGIAFFSLRGILRPGFLKVYTSAGPANALSVKLKSQIQKQSPSTLTK